MKIVDYGICLSIIFIGFLCVWSYKENVLYSHGFNTERVNSTMDKVVRDTLEKTVIDMKELYDEYNYMEKLPEYKELIIENLKKEMAFIFTGISGSSGIGLIEYKINSVFLLWGDNMYIYDGRTFEKKEIGEKKENERYKHIISLMEKASGLKINLSHMNYERENKLGDYSLSVIYYSDKGSCGGSDYIIKSFSSAKLLTEE